MEEARKVICLADVGREVQAGVSSKQHQTRGVRVWKPKHGAYETRVSEALPTGAMFNNAMSASLLRDTRPVFLR